MIPVSVDELQRAWRSVQAGEFRHPDSRRLPSAARARVWTPSADEGVLLVAGSAGSVGATTVAVALATSKGGPARVVECSPAAASGLAAASVTELGMDASGWVRGARGDVLLERCDPAWGATDDLPVPGKSDGPTFTVVDLGWRPLAGWRARALADARVLVAVTRATVPGLRRLETQLASVGPGRRVVAAVVGLPRKRWPRALHSALGALARALDGEGLVVTVSEDASLAVHGITPAPLPAPVLAAAGVVLDRLEGVRA